MDAVKYFEEKRRMFDKLGRIDLECEGVSCNECPFATRNNGKDLNCDHFELVYPELAVEIVEKWSAENPQKTILHDFLEKHPNAPLRESGLPKYVCPNLLGYIDMEKESCPDCVGCWNRPLEG
jgi:hypothetical protein